MFSVSDLGILKIAGRESVVDFLVKNQEEFKHSTTLPKTLSRILICSGE